MKTNEISLLQIEDHNAYLYNTGAFSHGVLLDKKPDMVFSRSANTWFHFKTAENATRPSNELTQNDTDHSKKHETKNRLLMHL